MKIENLQNINQSIQMNYNLMEKINKIRYFQKTKSNTFQNHNSNDNGDSTENSLSSIMGI